MPSPEMRAYYLSVGRCSNCSRPLDRDRTTCTLCATRMRQWYVQRTGAAHLAPQAHVVGLYAPVELCCSWWTAGPTALPWTCPLCRREVRSVPREPHANA